MADALYEEWEKDVEGAIGEYSETPYGEHTAKALYLVVEQLAKLRGALLMSQAADAEKPPVSEGPGTDRMSPLTPCPECGDRDEKYWSEAGQDWYWACSECGSGDLCHRGR